HLHPVVPGAHGRPDVPHERRIASLVQRSLRAAADGRFRRLLHAVDRARRHRAGDHGGGLGDGRPGLPPPLPRLDPRLLYGHLQPDHPGAAVGPGCRPDVPVPRDQAVLVLLGARGAAHLDAAVRAADHVRGVQPLQPGLRGGGPRPRGPLLADALERGASHSPARDHRGGAVRVHALVRRVPLTLIPIGSRNTLPLEIWAMTTNVTSPALYALGTLTTAISFVAIAIALTSIALIQRRRTRRGTRADAGD